jgi:hypothetical protein
MVVRPEAPQGRGGEGVSEASLRFVTSKPKLRRMLEMASIDQELDTIWWRYDANAIFQKQIDPSMTIAVVARFNKSFFTEYQGVGEGELKIPSTIYDVVKKFFKETESVDFTAKGGKLTLKGRDEVYEGDLLQVELPTFEGEVRETDYALMPELNAGIKGVYGIDSEEWSVKADEIRIHYGDKLRISVSLEEGGTYSRYPKVLTKADVQGEGSVLLDGKIFKTIIDLFSGPLYLIVTDGPVVLAQKTSEYSITYVIAPKVESE